VTHKEVLVKARLLILLATLAPIAAIVGGSYRP